MTRNGLDLSNEDAYAEANSSITILTCPGSCARLSDRLPQVPAYGYDILLEYAACQGLGAKWASLLYDVDIFRWIYNQRLAKAEQLPTVGLFP